MPVNLYTCRVVAFDKQNALFKRLLVLFVLSFFFFSIQFINAQPFQIDKPSLPIDSLKRVLPLLRDSARVDCLNELTRSYFEARQWDSAMVMVKHAYNDASAINYIKGLGDAALRYGLIYSFPNTNIPAAEKYYREAISWHEKIPYDNGLGFGFRGLGFVLLWKDSPDEAMKAFKQSELHFRAAGNQIMLADLIDCFGEVYQFKGEFEKQFEHVKRGLREKKRINDNRGIVM